MISVISREKLFQLLLRNCSLRFSKYLSAYKDLLDIKQESFEVSCELVDDVRSDNIRLAILGLNQTDVKRWIRACGDKIILTRDFLFDNAHERCFAIGLADYPDGAGTCRRKFYNFYGRAKSEKIKIKHIEKILSLLGIPNIDFKNDCVLFSKIEASGLDLDNDNRATIKVYFGPFSSTILSEKCVRELVNTDIAFLDLLKRYQMFSATVLFCVGYARSGRSVRVGLRYRTENIKPYLQLFDRYGQVLRFVSDFYKEFPKLSLQVVTVQRAPVKKMQFYFLLKN